jgi:hypothetical protein
MNLEDKELLFKDIAARLPYGVKIKVRSNDVRTVRTIDVTSGIVTFVEPDSISPFGIHIEHPTTFRQVVKPYLKPMSSMTEKEFLYFMGVRGMNFKPHEIREMMSEYFNHPDSMAIVNRLCSYSHNIDWLNENMFDYRGLIDKNLAIPITEENNPYKE